jgi:hypothetical protein
MRAARVARLIFLLAVSLMLGCGHTRQPATPAAPVGTMPPLPAPSSLRSASGPPSDYQRRRNGTNHEAALPANKFDTGTFSPTWDAAGANTVNDLSYAVYVLTNMNGYAGERRIVTDWFDAPDPADVYYGVANFTADRWEWFAAGADFEATIPELDPYTSPTEEMYICIMVLGSDSAMLEYVLFGEAFIDFVHLATDLDPNPQQNVAPLTVEFNSTLSEFYGSEVVAWDWDWDSDGTWDVEGDTDGIEDHVFDAGTWTTTVQVHDDAGHSATESIIFVAVNPDNQAPNAQFNALTLTGPAPLANTFDAQLASDPDGLIIRYEWDFDGDGEFEFDGDTGPFAAYTFGRRGPVTVTLRVTDNDLATDTASQVVTLTSGWRTVQIATGLDILSYENHIGVGLYGNATKRPCVVYHDFATRNLYFSKVLAEDGSTWAAAVEPVNNAGEVGYSPSVVGRIDGVPLIAYGVRQEDPSNFQLYAVSAQDATASLWELPVLVSGADAGYGCQVALINTVPAIAAHVGNSQLNSSVHYFLAQNAQGTSWASGVVALANAGGIYSDIALGTSGAGPFKRPAVAYYSSGNPDGLGFAAATDVDGTAWGAPFTFSGIDAQQVSTLLVNGRPAMLLGDSFTDGELRYVRAQDANGSAWDTPTVIGGGGFPSLGILDGKPAACFHDGDEDDLYFITALDADGTAWNAPYKVDSVGAVGESCRLVINGGTMPVICYYDRTNSRLLAAYWD